MKKILSIILLLIILTPITIKAESKYLYDVLKYEAEKEGGLAKEYTREHQDSTEGTGTEKIYHFFAGSNEEANQILQKRNVIFGRFCWAMFRTTDTGGVKLIYNGVANNGKCNSSYTIIGKSKYSIYDELDSFGSTGYMHNTLYDSNNYVTPYYGSYSQNGTKLSESDYTIVSNTSNPFTFLNNNWKNGRKSDGYSGSGIITFSVKTSGDYVLDINYSKNRYYDSLIIYKNNKKINAIPSTMNLSIPLENLQTTDTIKIDFHVDSNSQTSLTFYLKKPTGPANDTRAYFGNSVTYSNGMYTLVDTIRADITMNYSNNHYFCGSGKISCDKVYYAISWGYSSMSAVYLENGMDISDFINEQLYKDDTNKYDSALKTTIDTWYENNLIDYQKYLEDTVFCQKKELPYENNALNPNGGNPTGGSPNTYFYISENRNLTDTNNEGYLYNSNLKCNNKTDRYSISNPYAKLKYPIATINYAEQLLLSNSEYDNYGLRSASDEYWTMSPRELGRSTYGWLTWREGGLSYSYGADERGVRPVISLRKGTTYKEGGDGSSDNPFVINDIYSIDIEIKDETEDINVEINDLTQVEYEEEVTFKVKPIKGYKLKSLKVLDTDNNEIDYTATGNENEYTFIMPASDVTITPNYEKVSSSITIDDNKDAGKIIVEVNDSSAVLYEDKVVIKVSTNEGYNLSKLEIKDSEGNIIEYTKTDNEDEYEFSMPASNVTITPIYATIKVPDTQKDKNYTIYIVVGALLIIGIIFVIINKKRKI